MRFSIVRNIPYIFHFFYTYRIFRKKEKYLHTHPKRKKVYFFAVLSFSWPMKWDNIGLPSSFLLWLVAHSYAKRFRLKTELTIWANSCRVCWQKKTIVSESETKLVLAWNMHLIAICAQYAYYGFKIHKFAKIYIGHLPWGDFFHWTLSIFGHF